MIGVVPLPDPLHHRIIPAVALATHAGDQAMTGQQAAMGLAGVLVAAVGVYDSSRLGLPQHDSHLQGRTHQFGRHVFRSNSRMRCCSGVSGLPIPAWPDCSASYCAIQRRTALSTRFWSRIPGRRPGLALGGDDYPLLGCPPKLDQRTWHRCGEGGRNKRADPSYRLLPLSYSLRTHKWR